MADASGNGNGSPRWQWFAGIGGTCLVILLGATCWVGIELYRGVQERFENLDVSLQREMQLKDDSLKAAADALSTSVKEHFELNRTEITMLREADKSHDSTLADIRERLARLEALK